MEGNRDIAEQKGIIPNSFAHIFGHIAKAEGDKRYIVNDFFSVVIELYSLK